jgi:hypothetical protein
VATYGDPGDYGNFSELQKFFRDVFIHTDRGAEDSGADVGEACEIQKALHGAVFAKSAVDDREDYVEALAAAAAVEADHRGIRGIGVHHNALTLAEDFREKFLRSGADQPVAFFRDADGDGFVFVWIEAADDGGGGGQGNFVFAAAAAEEDADAEAFLIWGHENIFSEKCVGLKGSRWGSFQERDGRLGIAEG